MAKPRSAKLSVAVVILNWNGKALSQSCLASWQKSKPAPKRILLVDNGSSDGSVAYLKKRFKGVEFLALPTNLGFAAGNNRGFEYLWRKGPKVEAVFICNNDTEVEPDMLSRLWTSLKARSHWGAVGPGIVFHGSQCLWFEGADIRLLSGRPRHLHYNAPARAQAEPFELGKTGFITGCGLLIRAAALKQENGFDESYWAYAEDSDLCLRLRAKGLASGVVPAARMSHKVSASFKVGSPLAMFHITRNSLWLLRRHHLGFGFLTLACFAAYSLARGLRSLLLGQPASAWAILRGLKQGWFA